MRHNHRLSAAISLSRRYRRLFCEQLEERTLLATNPANVFANFFGVVPSGGSTQIAVSLQNPADFTLPTGQMELGFLLKPTGNSTLVPDIVQVSQGGSVLTPVYANANLPNGAGSISLVQLGPSAYTLTVDGQNGSAGAFELEITLPGDADGNGTVNTADGQQIKSMLAGKTAYNSAADANLDGVIDSTDVAQWSQNRNDATTITPLTLTANLGPKQIPLASGTLLTNVAASSVSGTVTSSDVTVTLGINGTFGTPVAVSNGQYSLPLALSEGNNSVQVLGTDSFGQTSLATLPVVLDDIPPTVPTFNLAAGTITPQTIETTTAARVTLVGQTDANVTLTLVGTGLTALSSGTGAFQIPGVNLAVGADTLTVVATDQAGNTSSYSLTVTRSTASSQPNAVIVWNQATLNAIQTDGTDPLMSSRALAMVQAGVYDAVNNIEGTPAYYVKIMAPADADINAAVDAAAHDVLGYLYPAQQTTFDALLTTQLALLPAGQGTTDGETVGQAVGNAIIALRANDGATNYVAFEPGTAAGDWQPTAPMYAPALDPQGGNMTPWAMTSDTQFDPAGPPALTSQQWADAVNQVESLGAVNSTTRTAAETTSAQFWNDGLGTYTPSGHWNQIAQTVAQQEGNSLADDARLFAELNVSMADAGIATWNTKYLFDTWRPITVIQSGGDGVNPAVTANSTWMPLLLTPNFPEYVSGHSTFSMAAATVLDSFFGDNVTFTTGEQTTTLSETYTSFQQAAQDAGMSRLYGGIHFIFSIQDGWTVGQEVANFDLATFSVSQDTTPPKVNLNNVLPSGASNTNVTITGQTTDNLVGVASLQVQVDGGSYVPVTFSSTTGNFSFTTSFALNGTADGQHTINFQATNNAGIVAMPVAFTFTLATQAPTLTLTSPTDGGALADGTLLTGTATGESTITSLCYAFDGSTTFMPVVFGSDGSFSQALDLSKLAAGSHTLTVKVQDAAGNTTTETLHLTMAAPIALTVTSLTPTNGSNDASVTIRPKVIFSRPIDTTTLNSSNFFATDPNGGVLPATIVPSNDGTYAWLYFTNPLPGASTITLIVDGSTIQAADGSLLDAADDGQAGSNLTSTFSTVNQMPVLGTTLSGILADPGPDLKPGTRDDVRSGPDAVLGTGDDIYLRPIEGVEVYILGQQNQAVYTDAQGRFSFASVPTGDVKLAIVGNVTGVMMYDPDQQQFVAPNSEGFYFPEMVMDLTIQPGVANTVMGTMGTADEEAANATDLGVYLPRVQTAILQTVSDTQPTTIDVPAQAAPDLTPQQRQYLSLTIQPNSAIGMDGQVMNNVQIGISTVPTSLIKDMLPPGLTQPPFTITVQAPGVATFTTPVTLTFPNITDAAPGTKLEFMSFDHTTGRLEVEGTATVSADGLSVVTDPDSGLTHPGWHFVAPLAVFQGNVNPDQSKGDHNNPTLLGQEYGLPWVSPFVSTPTISNAGYLAGQAAFLGSRVRLGNDPVALGFFNIWANGTGDLGSLNQTAAQEFVNDANFKQQVVQTDIQQIKSSEPADHSQNFTVNLTPHQFAPATEDLQFSYGRQIQCLSVQGSGNVSDDGSVVTDATLTYTFKVLYGYGSQEAHKRPITDFAGDDFFFLRLMQLAGYATPFTTTVTVTVHIENDQITGNGSQVAPQDVSGSAAGQAFAMITPAVAPQATLSTVPGFGTDPKVYYRFDLANGLTITGKTDAEGNLNGILFPALTNYTGTFYQPSTNSWTSIVGNSGPSGEPFGLGGADSTITLDHFGGVDSTGDGLPDIARYVIGLKVGVRSFAGDGIDDATKLDEGLDPLAGKAFPTGVIATLPMPGTVEKLAVDGNRIYEAVGKRRAGNRGRRSVQQPHPARNSGVARLRLRRRRGW